MAILRAIRTWAPRPLIGFVAVAGGVGLLAWLLFFSPGASPHTALSAVVSRCPTAAAAAKADAVFAAATKRYGVESSGHDIHVDLRQIAGDSVLLEALRAGNFGAALTAANRQLVRHVVRIRVLVGSRVLVDANPTSFDVAGSAMELHTHTGAPLGRLQITVQDVIGFIKLIHKLNHADVVVRGDRGHLRTSLAAAASLTLPRSGCTRIGARRYVVRSFNEQSVSGEALTIWLLSAA